MFSGILPRSSLRYLSRCRLLGGSVQAFSEFPKRFVARVVFVPLFQRRFLPPQDKRLSNLRWCRLNRTVFPSPSASSCSFTFLRVLHLFGVVSFINLSLSV